MSDLVEILCKRSADNAVEMCDLSKVGEVRLYFSYACKKKLHLEMYHETVGHFESEECLGKVSVDYHLLSFLWT